jgi:hypothetical protein
VKTVCLTLRGCPVEVHRALKQEASSRQRSIRAQALDWLQKQSQAVRRRPSEKELSRRIRATRSQVSLSAKEVRMVIEQGRS